MMRLPKFEYRLPGEVKDAVRMMADAGPQGQFVAGGTDLYPNMKRRQQTPRTVISVGRVAELTRITGDGQSGVRIGAGVSLTDLCEHPVINRDYPMV
ncbi:MAG TPA: FAD binding domain-containing protein, partial [Pyrinomonadaceae bacterium]